MLYSPDRPTASTIRFQGDSDSRVCLNRRTGAHQVAVSKRCVDPADRRPHLVLARGGGREAGAVAGVGPVQPAGSRSASGIGAVLSKVVVPTAFPFPVLPNSPPVA